MLEPVNILEILDEFQISDTPKMNSDSVPVSTAKKGSAFLKVVIFGIIFLTVSMLISQISMINRYNMPEDNE